MKTFTSPFPQHRGYVFTDVDIVWNPDGIRKQVHESSLGKYIHIKNIRHYLADIRKAAIGAGHADAV